jgi:thioredoxin
VRWWACCAQTVVDFFAEWCGPCKMISPYIGQLEKEFPNVQFVKVDVDELEEVASLNNITAMPTFIFFRNGQKVHEFRGADKNRLLEAVKTHGA